MVGADSPKMCSEEKRGPGIRVLGNPHRTLLYRSVPGHPSWSRPGSMHRKHAHHLNLQLRPHPGQRPTSVETSPAPGGTGRQHTGLRLMPASMSSGAPKRRSHLTEGASHNRNSPVVITFVASYRASMRMRRSAHADNAESRGLLKKVVYNKKDFPQGAHRLSTGPFAAFFNPLIHKKSPETWRKHPAAAEQTHFPMTFIFAQPPQQIRRHTPPAHTPPAHIPTAGTISGGDACHPGNSLSRLFPARDTPTIRSVIGMARRVCPVRNRQAKISDHRASTQEIAAHTGIPNT